MSELKELVKKYGGTVERIRETLIYSARRSSQT